MTTPQQKKRELLRQQASTILQAYGMGDLAPRKKKQKKPRWNPRAAEEKLARLASDPRPTPVDYKRDKRKVYVIGATDYPIKIGIASDPKIRLKGIQTGCPRELKIYRTVRVPPGVKALAVEAECHLRLVKHRLMGEWFDVSPEDAMAVVEDVVAMFDRMRRRTAQHVEVTET